MKTNKRFIMLVVLVISAFGLIQCQSTKISFQKTIPFTLNNSYYQDWVGGQPGIQGTNVALFVTNSEGIQPDSLYFHKRAAKIEVRSNEKGVLWMTQFKTLTRNDINMTQNSSGEYGNKVPEMSNFPFELEKDEAVLRYTKNEKVYYYKITEIKEKEALIYPSAKPRN